jgi:hypothetical protein
MASSSRCTWTPRSRSVNSVIPRAFTPGDSDGMLVGVFQGNELPYLYTVLPPTGSAMWYNPHPYMDYHIMVTGAGAHAVPGDFTARLSFEIASPLDNDAFENRLLLAGESCAAGGNNYNATLESGEEVLGETGSTTSLWYAWTAPVSGVLYLNCGSVYGDQPFVVTGYRGVTLAELIPLGRLPDAGMEVAAGETVSIRLAGPFEGGRFWLDLMLHPLRTHPGNDQFDQRLALNPLAYHLDSGLALATVEPGEPLASPAIRHTLWWELTVSEPGLLNVWVESPHFQPALACYAGVELSELRLIPPETDQDPNSLFAAFALTEAGTYAFQLGGAGVGGGSFSMNAFFQTFGHDHFAHAQVLDGESLHFYADNRWATHEPHETLPVTNSVGKTLWYSWVAPQDAWVTLAGWPSTDTLAIAVYRGVELPTLTQVGAGKSTVQWVATAGERYFFQLDPMTSTPTAFSMSLTGQRFEPGYKDSFYQAAPLSPCDRSIVGARVDSASLEPGEPDHGIAGPVKSLWWRWQAPTNGTLVVRRLGTEPENLGFAIYQGDLLSELRSVQRAANQVQVPVRGGEFYYLALVVDEAFMGAVAFEHFSYNFAGSTVPVPGNLVVNPSFEDPAGLLVGWELPESATWTGHRGSPGADGISSIALGPGTWISQELDTEAGESYEVRLAVHRGGTAIAQLQVAWDDTVLGVAPAIGGCWSWLRFHATATSARSRLEVTALDDFVGLDAFSVVRMTEPRILAQPVARSAFAGSQVVFAIDVATAGDLNYQWFLDGQPIPGARDRTLMLNPVRLEHAGQYRAEVWNLWGRVSSQAAELTVESPALPVLLLQPWGGTFPAGTYHALSVLAAGDEPLVYQWYRDEESVPGQNSRHFVFPALVPDQAGHYKVRVTNPLGEVWSLPARISVDTELAGGACVLFSNGDFMPSRTPVLDVDGTTPLAGPDCVAQLYAGRSIDQLVPAGTPQPFFFGPQAGFFSPDYVLLPGIQPGDNCYLQIRAWDTSRGASYEEARALGGRYGRSGLYQLTAQGPMIDCGSVEGLESFQLEAGRPQFNVGRLFLDRSTDGEKRSWRLDGEPDGRYLIERAESDFVWRPWQVVTNSTVGTLLLPDLPEEEIQAFFRARLLD